DGMQRLRGPQLPHAQGDPRRQPSRAEKVLPQGAQAYAPQGIAEEVGASANEPAGNQRMTRSRAAVVLSAIEPVAAGPCRRTVAQLVWQPSPKRPVGGSSPSAPASRSLHRDLRAAPNQDEGSRWPQEGLTG